MTNSAELLNLYPALRKNIEARNEVHAMQAEGWSKIPADRKGPGLSALWQPYSKHWEVMSAHQKQLTRLAAKVGAGASLDADDAEAIRAALDDADLDKKYEAAFAEALSAEANRR